ncbi:MAG: hypothetical protein QNK03_12800 [Myxococcota bacterium]|nr:hypothetical protein [Myxococcota bacterium]
MRPCRLPAACVLTLAAALLAPATAFGQGKVCEPAAGAVMVVVVDSPRQVRTAVAGMRGRALVATEDTVIYADGRVITASVEATSRHLNELGWAHRRLQLVGGVARAPTPRRG